MEVSVDLFLVSSVIFALIGVGFMSRYFYLDYKSRNEKSFVVIGLGILAFWFFGGTGLLAIAVLLACLFLIRGC